MLAVVASEPASAYVLVTGRVQGVGFRWFVRSHASALELRGWARNRRDGSVELEAVGPRERIEQLIAELRAGPPASEVEEVTVHWLPAPPAGGPAGFEIRATA
jgi:acylphosphatase